MASRVIITNNVVKSQKRVLFWWVTLGIVYIMSYNDKTTKYENEEYKEHKFI
jgi:hypothetical protein